MPRTRPERIEAFNLKAGRKIGRLYEVVRPLGRGIEGEVYQIQERDTGIQRAAKLYFPHRDPKQKSIVWHAKKLNRLRHCPIVLQYHHTEAIHVARREVRCMISELCEGEPLEAWILRHRGKRLRPFRALHVLYQLVCGLEAVHALGEYHADVHSGNILIRPEGIGFEIKLVDFYDWGKPSKAKQRQDVLDAVRVFHECLGGRAHYAQQSSEVRYICAGLKHDLIDRRFPSMSALRAHLEHFQWSSTLSM